MGRDNTQQTTPDLFSTDAVRDASPLPTKPVGKQKAVNSSSQRHVLPRNLRKAVKHLSDGELDLLHAATLEEMARRDRLPPNVASGLGKASSGAPSPEPKRVLPTDRLGHQRKVIVAAGSLPRGQVNAVRAAFNAGITPSRIARQFGLSQAAVRKALANDETK